MINFNAKKFDHVRDSDSDLMAVLKSYTDTIHKDLAEWKTNFFYLGLHLTDLYVSNAYATNPYSIGDLRVNGWNVPIGAGNCCSAFFFAYCYEKFGLDKSQVSRYMNIVDEFGDGGRGFKKAWDKFSYSQLCEMLPLSAEERKPIKPNWTIKQIRDYKKTLAVKPQSEGKDETPEEQPPTKYARFEKWTKNELCDKIFELEAERETLLSEIEQLRATQATEESETKVSEAVSTQNATHVSFRSSRLVRGLESLLGGDAE